MNTRLLLGLALLLGSWAAGRSAAGSEPSAPVTRAEQQAEAKIEGLAIARPDGRWLGLTLEDGKFKLRFYDRDRQPVAADVLRVAARWPNTHGPGQNRTVLTPVGDGTALIGAQFVRPPRAFKLFLTLITTEGVEPSETYAVDFRG